MERANRLTERLRGVEKDQKAVDEIYEEVVGVIKQGLVEDECRGVREASHGSQGS